MPRRNSVAIAQLLLDDVEPPAQQRAQRVVGVRAVLLEHLDDLVAGAALLQPLVRAAEHKVDHLLRGQRRHIFDRSEPCFSRARGALRALAYQWSKWPPQAAKRKITIYIGQKLAGWPLDFPAADRNRLAAPKTPISIARSLTVWKYKA